MYIDSYRCGYTYIYTYICISVDPCITCTGMDIIIVVMIIISIIIIIMVIDMLIVSICILKFIHECIITGFNNIYVITRMAQPL